MSKTPIKPRKDAYLHQSGRCYYCQQPMWLDDRDSFVNQYGLSAKESARFQCTAEHLKARQNGGTDDVSNIVAACVFCNRARHRPRKALEPEPYKQFVHQLQSRGHWHSPKLLSKLATGEDGTDSGSENRGQRGINANISGNGDPLNRIRRSPARRLR